MNGVLVHARRAPGAVRDRGALCERYWAPLRAGSPLHPTYADGNTHEMPCQRPLRVPHGLDEWSPACIARLAPTIRGHPKGGAVDDAATSYTSL